jgi:DNA modification methylase
MNPKIICGSALDVLNGMPNASADVVLTSPPYWGKRDYGEAGQLGLEERPEDYIANLCTILNACKRVLKKEGSLWLNLGDSYWAIRSQNGASWADGNMSKEYQKRAGGKRHPVFKPKDLMMLPSRVAIALQESGWYLRQQVIWHKPDALPESVKDRPTTDYELVYLLSKSRRYFYDSVAVKEPAKDWGMRDRSEGKYTSGTPPISGSPHAGLTNGNFAEDGRNKRAVWSINTANFKGAHFATMPLELAETCIKASCPVGGIVLDPFGGSGTTAEAAISLNRDYRLIELNPEYVLLAEDRVQNVQRPLFL